MKLAINNNLASELQVINHKTQLNKIYVNYYTQGVRAGFPSPAEDFTEVPLSLDEKYLQNPEATFLVKVAGDSMIPTLCVGDILVVKSNVELSDRDIAIVSVNYTDFTVKRYDKQKSMLIADNQAYRPITLSIDDSLTCLGVVKHIIRDI